MEAVIQTEPNAGLAENRSMAGIIAAVYFAADLVGHFML